MPTSRQNHLVTAGYDKTIRLVDVRTGALVRSFVGHRAPVCSTIFNPHGNLIVSGSKDHTVKFWDLSSGLCVNSIGSHLGEITSVALSASGLQLLTCCKDNSHRLWDLRMVPFPPRNSRRQMNAHAPRDP